MELGKYGESLILYLNVFIGLLAFVSSSINGLSIVDSEMNIKLLTESCYVEKSGNVVISVLLSASNEFCTSVAKFLCLTLTFGDVFLFFVKLVDIVQL